MHSHCNHTPLVTELGKLNEVASWIVEFNSTVLLVIFNPPRQFYLDIPAKESHTLAKNPIRPKMGLDWTCTMVLSWILTVDLGISSQPS